MKNIILSFFVLASVFFANDLRACHAIALVNFSVTTNANSATVNASSNSPTCGCANYWLDVEVRCIGEPFDAAPFNPGFWGPLNSYPYFQSAQMPKNNCVVQPYPPVTIPFSGLCAGVQYQVRARENHNGQIGPWTSPQTFVVPGVVVPLVASVSTSSTTICVGDCVSLSTVITGGCSLSLNYNWSTGSSASSINVCPTVTTTYSVNISEDCSNLNTTASIVIQVLPPPIVGVVSISDVEVCEGQTVTLTNTGSTGNVQWQASQTSGGPWTSIAGATGPSFTTPPLTASACYRSEVTGCGPAVFSNVVCVNVIPTVTPTFSALGPYCQCATSDALPTTSNNGIVGVWNPTTISTNTSGTTTYTFTSNSGQCVIQTLMEVTVNPIVFTMPVNTGVTVDCPLETNLEPTAPIIIDDCNRTLAVSTPVVSSLPSCSESRTYTYTYTDACGVAYPWVYTYSLNPPSVVMPINEGSTVSCTTDIVEPVFPIVQDNCGRMLVVSAPVVSPAPVCGGTQTYTYAYTDCAGASNNWVYTYTFIDNIDPTASNPADITVPGGPVPAPDITVVTDEADNCTTNPTVAWVSDVSDNGACPEIITRIYSVTDDCGNQITVTQLIYITDPFPPTASNPLPIAVQCIGDVPSPDISVVVDASDNNGNATVTYEDDSSNGQTCPEIITRRYRVTDICSNFIFVEQTITVNDDINPVGNAPTDITVVCQSDVPAPDVMQVTGVSDNCTVNPQVAHLSDVSDNNVCNGEIITRSYLITDDCGNSITVVQLITISLVAPSFTITSSNPTTCSGSEGFITFDGFNPNESYMFTYNGNAASSITTNASGQYVLSGLTAGIYSNFQFYSPQCPSCLSTSTAIVNLVDPNAPSIDAGQNQTVCDGIQVVLIADNPNGATISWNNGVNDGVSFASPIGTVQYVVTANLNNCISTDEVTITVNPIPNVDAGPNQFICEGEFLSLNGSGANSYVWDNGVANGQPFSPAQTTTYTVVGTSIGCSASDQMTVTVNVQPQVSFSATVLEGCTPVYTEFTNTTTNVTSAGCSWSINNLAVLNGCNQSFTFSQAGCFNITLQVTSDGGCVGSTTYQNYICVDDYPVANFGVSPLFLSPTDNQASFNNSSIGAETYEWNFGDGTTSSAADPQHIYYSDGEESFIIQLIAFSELGCPDTTYGRIDMREDLIFYVPNTFTPDEDDYNQFFLPIFTSGFDPYDFNLLILNRWGEILFESNNHQVGWDGTYGGKLVKDGTYVWKIEFRTKYTDERKVHHGHINILR